MHHGVEKLLDAHARGDQDRPREHGRQQQSVMDAVADGLRRIPTSVELGAPPDQAEEHPAQQDEEDLPCRRPNVAFRDRSECEERDHRQDENGVSAGEQPGDEDEHHRRDNRDGVQPRAPSSGGSTGPGAFVQGRPCAGRGQCAIPPGRLRGSRHVGCGTGPGDLPFGDDARPIRPRSRGTAVVAREHNGSAGPGVFRQRIQYDARARRIQVRQRLVEKQQTAIGRRR